MYFTAWFMLYFIAGSELNSAKFYVLVVSLDYCY